MFSTYAQTIEYLYSALPMFQRVGAVAYKKDLTNTLLLCEALGNPHTKFKSLHVAGTNGKGSTSHMLASVLQSAGYKTGLYTSPHLKDFSERIRINGEPVSEEFIIDFVNRIQPEIERIKPSFFEITVAMAFDYFARQHVDVAVIEVGLGGRLDSTNVITPDLSVITNIGFDHKDLLGDTLPAIAGEKAGIIKPHVPVVISEHQPEVAEVFQQKARACGSALVMADAQYAAVWNADNTMTITKDHAVLWPALALPLLGLYQTKNVCGVLAALDILNNMGYSISREAVQHGLTQVVTQTGLKGRWQLLQARPRMICDTGHNAEGVREVLKQLRAQSYKTLHMVWGMVNDKDISTILAMLPTEANYYFCEAKIPRAMDAGQLQAQAAVHGLHGVVERDVNAAIGRAQAAATPDDLIFIGGSTFVVAEIENL